MRLLATTRRRVALAFALAIVVLLVLWDWNWFKGPLERRVEQQTGRRFEIGGDLDVDLGWNPRVTLDDLRFANADWGRAPQMVTAERADITLNLRELIAGRLNFPRLVFTAPNIQLETGPKAAANWQLTEKPPAEEEEGEPDKGMPVIGVLQIDRGVLVYYDPPSKTDVRVDLATRKRGDKDGIVATARGTLRSLPLQIDATGGALLSLTDTREPYAFDARFQVGRTRGTVGGSVTGLQTFAAAKLDLDVGGDTLAALHPLTGLALPETPPYRIKGQLDHDGERWTFRDFSGSVGDSDLSGTATVRYGAKQRPDLVADLRSRQLDLDDLAGMVGATPDTGKGETASPQQARKAAVEAAGSTVLPDRPIDLSALRSMDADVKYRAQSIRHKKAPLDDLDAHLLLKDGVLDLDPLDFGIAGGKVASDVRMDARKDTLQLDSKIDFERLDLARLLPGNDTIASATGLIGGRAHLAGQGDSTADLLASADGDLGIAMRGGQFSSLLIEGVGLDAAEALGRLIGGDRKIGIRCAVMDLQAKKGVFTPRAFVVDTSDTAIHVSGSVDMGKEALDLTIHPLPKDFSPLALRSPLHLRGTFKDPKVRPDAQLLLRGGAAAALATLVTPLAALLPLIETGPGKNQDCEALIAATQKTADTAAR